MCLYFTCGGPVRIVDKKCNVKNEASKPGKEAGVCNNEDTFVGGAALAVGYEEGHTYVRIFVLVGLKTFLTLSVPGGLDFF